MNLEMTEGDITRLNRMYKCPDFVEEEQAKDDDELSKSLSDEVGASNKDPAHKIGEALKGQIDELISYIDSLRKHLKDILMYLGGKL